MDAQTCSKDVIKQTKTFDIVVGTRIHWSSQSIDQPIDVENTLQNIISFCKRANEYADGILVAIGLQSGLNITGALNSSILEFSNRLEKEVINLALCPVICLRLSYWGKFVPSLNALVTTAATSFPSISLLLLQSLEIDVNKAQVSELKRHFNINLDLVVGARLPGHDFNLASGLVQPIHLNGRTTPWNTLALWNLTALSKIGFPLIADGIHVDTNTQLQTAAGVEEVAAITIYQQLFPNVSRAQVVEIEGIDWHVDTFEDELRTQWQETKMQSKIERAAAQMKHLDLPLGVVFHIKS